MSIEYNSCYIKKLTKNSYLVLISKIRKKIMISKQCNDSDNVEATALNEIGSR